MPDFDATANVLFFIERSLTGVVLLLLGHAFLVFAVERCVPILLLREPIKRII